MADIFFSSEFSEISFTPTESGEWTFLIYRAGDSSILFRNTYSLQQGITFILRGIDRILSADIAASGLFWQAYRFQVTKAGFIDVYASGTINDRTSSNTGSKPITVIHTSFSLRARASEWLPDNFLLDSTTFHLAYDPADLGSFDDSLPSLDIPLYVDSSKGSRGFSVYKYSSLGMTSSGSSSLAPGWFIHRIYPNREGECVLVIKSAGKEISVRITPIQKSTVQIRFINSFNIPEITSFEAAVSKSPKITFTEAIAAGRLRRCDTSVDDTFTISVSGIDFHRAKAISRLLYSPRVWILNSPLHPVDPQGEEIVIQSIDTDLTHASDSTQSLKITYTLANKH